MEKSQQEVREKAGNMTGLGVRHGKDEKPGRVLGNR